MAYVQPSIPDDKIDFYRRKLWREVNNLFTWTGLPGEIPLDYLERSLTMRGRAMFFYDDKAYGYMALECMVRGFNLYNQPTEAYAVAPNDQMLPGNYTRKVIHKYDEEIGPDKSCVLINNMYAGESLFSIVDHYATRLSMVQIAIDTNLIWQNLPVIFSASDETLKTSIEKLFSDIFTGKPWIIVDKTLLNSENEIIGNVTEVPFLLDKLYDVKNEIYNEFKSTIGLKAPGADKKERLLVDEVNSNEEATDTCLNIMLSQRKIFCEEAYKVFGLKIDVRLSASQPENENEEDEEDGSGNNGIEARSDDDRNGAV